MVNKHIVHATVNKPTVNKLTVGKLTVFRKRLLILNGNFSHRFVEFFQFARYYSISLICLSQDTTYPLKPLYVGIFK